MMGELKGIYNDIKESGQDVLAKIQEESEGIGMKGRMRQMV